MSWEECTLGDVVTLKRGHDLPNSSRKAGDVPVVSSSGFTGYHNEAKAKPPGVVTGRYGTIGEVFYVTEPYWPLNTALYAIDFHGNDPRFVAYFLRNKLRNYQSDKAAVPGVDRKVLHKIPSKCPDPQVQQRIVSVLSAYDDLIANNRRRIELLEESARLLYREWFVHFRFPGHEHVKVVDGVPEGWHVKVFEDLVDLIKESVKPDQFDAADIHIGLEHIPRRSMTLGDWGGVEGLNSHKFKFRADDIIFGKIRPYFHKVGFALRDGLTSSDSFVWRVRRGENWPLSVCVATSDHFVAVASKTVREGSKMPRADWKMLAAYRVLLPPEHLLLGFNEHVISILKSCKALALQNRELTKARDFLLPRLMDGRLEV